MVIKLYFVKYVDSDNNTWIGTDMGFVFTAWGRSRKLNGIESGLQGEIISISTLINRTIGGSMIVT